MVRRRPAAKGVCEHDSSAAVPRGCLPSSASLASIARAIFAPARRQVNSITLLSVESPTDYNESFDTGRRGACRRGNRAAKRLRSLRNSDILLV